MNNKKEYLKPSNTPFNLDRFIIRKGIMTVLRDTLPNFSGTLLDVGCGFKPYRSAVLSPPSRVKKYIGMDLSGNKYEAPDLEWDGNTIPLQNDSIDNIIATEVLEHCADPGSILAEIYRVLKPGGIFFLTVPFLWPLHDIPYDYYRYTTIGLEHLLKKTGFNDIQITPHGGWDASLAQIIGLWVSRRPMPKLLKIFLQIIIWPMFFFLIFIDNLTNNNKKAAIYPGLSGVARKPYSAS